MTFRHQPKSLPSIQGPASASAHPQHPLPDSPLGKKPCPSLWAASSVQHVVTQRAPSMHPPGDPANACSTLRSHLRAASCEGLRVLPSIVSDYFPVSKLPWSNTYVVVHGSCLPTDPQGPNIWDWIASSPNSHVGVLISSASECGHDWREGLYKGNQVKVGP